MKKRNVLFLLLIAFSCQQQSNIFWDAQWECEVFPSEHKVSIDPATGAKLLFVTTDSACDVNFYFDMNCWTADQVLLAFYSDRLGQNELFGYLSKTGEVVRLQPLNQPIAGHATVDYQSHDIYVIYNNTVYQWHFNVDLSHNSGTRSQVIVQERKITSAPENRSFFVGLTESADGKYLSNGLQYQNSDVCIAYLPEDWNDPFVND